MSHTRIRTVADLKAFLAQFADDTNVEFSLGRYFDEVGATWEGDKTTYFYGPEFEYEPARQAWNYVPSPEAIARGSKPANYGYRPATIRFGAEIND